MNADIEKIFIAFANNSLSNDPANLKKTYQEISNFCSIPDDIKFITELSIQLLIKFAEFKSFSDANSYKSQLIAQKGKFSSFPIHTFGHTTVSKFRALVIESVFSYVYGYKEGYCQHLCPNFGGVQKTYALGKEQIENSSHLKCFECDQQYVRYILNEIVKGNAFSKIIGFPQFIANGRMLFRSGLSIRKEDSLIPHKEIITEETIYDPTSQVVSLGKFIGCAVSYSLGCFLVRTDSKKKNPLFLRLKKCNHCGKFKIAKRVTHKGANRFCSIECRDLFHRANRKETKYHSRYMEEYRML